MVTTKRNTSYARTLAQGNGFLAGTKDLSTNNERDTILRGYAYKICTNCFSYECIGSGYDDIIFAPSCTKCVDEFFPQGQSLDESVDSYGLNAMFEQFEQDINVTHKQEFLRNIPSFGGLFTDETKEDVKNNLNRLKKWLMASNKYETSFVSHYFKFDKDNDVYIKLIEDVIILVNGILTANNLAQRYLAVVTFCKLRGARIGFTTTCCYVLSDIFGSLACDRYESNKKWNEFKKEITERIDKEDAENFQAQAEFEEFDDDESPFSPFRFILDRWDSIKESQIWKKTYKFAMYVLSSQILSGINIDFKTFKFDEYEAKLIARSHKPGMNMIHCMCDTVLFICERAYDVYRYKDINMLFQSGKRFEKWISKAQKLVYDSKLLNNPDPHGINRFEFISDLKDAIEKGAALIKFQTNLDKGEKILLMKILNDLRMIEANELTKREAQKPRKDPFGILVHGSSSICKSQLKQILFYHYGKIFDHPTSPEYMYTRCPTDEYWSGFNSTQWCIVMDDIAFLKPNGEVDPTLKELLQVKNSVAYTPPQAALEDKGRTPVRAELLIGTTNTKDLNLHAYFACPFAIARRLSYIVTAEVKPEFAKHSIMADSKKIPITPDGEYMNIWNFTISEPRPAEEENKDRQMAKYVQTTTFDNINDFLVWYIERAKEHEESQVKALNADTTMAGAVVCKMCYKLSKFCECVEPQSEPLDHPVPEAPPDREETTDPFTSMKPMFKFKLYILSSLIQGPRLLHKHFGWIYEFMTLNPNIFILFCCLLFLMDVIPLFLFVGFLYVVIDYMWLLLGFYMRFKYGSYWKVKLAMKLFYNEYEAYRYILYLGRRKAMDMVPSWIVKYQRVIIIVSAVTITQVLAEKLATMLVGPIPVREGNPYSKPSDGTAPAPMESEKKPFYYHDPYRVTNMEISSQSRCNQGDRLYFKIEKNVARFNFKFDKGGCRTQAFNVSGNVWLFNTHTLEGHTEGTLDITFDPTSQNVSRNIIGIKFNEHMMTHIENDISFIELRMVPPGSNLIPYFPCDAPIPGSLMAKYFLISAAGERSMKDIVAVTPVKRTPIYGTLGYVGSVSEPTQLGDCGAPALAHIGSSLVILGIHCAGSTEKKKVVIHHISQRMINRAIEFFGLQVQRGYVPIDAPGYPREIVDLHPKSTIRFMQQGTAHVVGSFSGYRPKHKSKVQRTFIHPFVKADGYDDNFGAPDMTWKPWYLALSDMVATPHCYDDAIIKECEMSITQHLLDQFGDELSNWLQVYDLNTALNGVDGVTYVDKLNASTSAGNPFKKSKKYFLTEDENGKIIDLHPVIRDRIQDIEEKYSRGERFHAQFCNHLKDEALPMPKVLAGKTRNFSGGEMAWSITVRRFFLSHVRLIQNHPMIFEAMVGIVAQSSEWTDLYKYLTVHGEDRIIAGDYAKFDKKMAAPFILSAFNILIALSERAGWSEQDLMVMKCIAYDTAFPWMDFNGDLIEVQGNPSGHPLTVIINCLVNSLYMRYAWHQLGGKLSHFKLAVNLATYGDDNVMGVSRDADFFNHTAISKELAKIGVVYTMAEKDAESVPFVNIKDVSFLKRKFVYDPDVGAYVGPLEHKSIAKMLTTTVKSDEISIQAHSVCVIETALREYFFYGKETFTQRRKYFDELLDRAGLRPWQKQSTLPKYPQLVYEFWMRTDDHVNAKKYSGLDESTSVPSYQQNEFGGLTGLEGSNFVSQSLQGSLTRRCEKCCKNVLERSSCYHNECDNFAMQSEFYTKPIPTLSPKFTRERSIMHKFNPIQHDIKRQTIQDYQSEARHRSLEAIKAKKVFGTRKLKITSAFMAQSEPVVSFLNHEENEEVGIDAANHQQSTMDKTSETDLGLFLSRPVRINNFTWNESDTIGTTVQTIYPWQLWANNTYVKLKTNNYSWFRGDLCIRVQMVASPFYYGMLKMIYTPLHGLRSTDNYDTAGGSVGFLIPVSQRPHTDLEVGEADSYVMRIPFLYYKNWINMQSSQDFQDLGKIFFVVYAPLDSASATSSSGIGINTYAWVENVEVSGASVGYSMQGDEYGEGPVSRPASWVAKAASYFEDIPVIGTFATATKIGASAISSIASLFGFTNVPVIEDTKPLRPEAFPKFASSEIGFPIEKLTLDPKNELSVDPRIVGLPGDDEMMISSICSRESYLTYATFSTSNAIDDLLFYSNVNPQLYYNDNATNARIYMTPTCFMAQAFREWRGSIIFRFKVICSKYHKGKLRISFDPSGYSSANLYNTTETTNVVHTAIVDLSETKDIEFVIPYQQAYQFLATRGSLTRANQLWGTNNNSPTFSYDNNYDNGCITVRVLTPLTAPVASSTVNILVFTKAGPDIEFANPKGIDNTHKLSFFAPQSEHWEMQSKAYSDADSSLKKEMAPTAGVPDHQYLIHYGENIRSIRQLLRRTEMTQREGVPIDSSSSKYQIVSKAFNKMPLCPGYQTNGYATVKGIISTATTYNYNFSNLTYLTYFSNAFLCYRGSTHWSFDVDWAGSPLAHVRAYKNPNGGGLSALTTNSYAYTTQNSLSNMVNNLNNSGASGQALVDQRVQPGVNVSAPNYSRAKFQSCDPAYANQGIVKDGSNADAFYIEVHSPTPSTTNTGACIVTSYVSAGTDYGLYFFLNAPMLFNYSSVPTPT